MPAVIKDLFMKKKNTQIPGIPSADEKGENLPLFAASMYQALLEAPYKVQEGTIWHLVHHQVLYA